MQDPGPLAHVVAEKLGVSLERASQLLRSRSVRVLRYKDVTYVALRRDLHGHYEGTTILYHEPSGEAMLVEGYPHIQRILLLRVAVPRHFIDRVAVEEKMDGHNVRVVEFRGEIYAITRGGYICPYTTARMRRTYGPRLERLLGALPPGAVVAGEVVGMENPYTRFPYPEAPDWDYFIFDIFKAGLDPLPVKERRRLVDEHGLRNVPLHGVYDKEDVDSIAGVVRGLEEAGREGIVLKDPEYRVPPLKYTTSYINVNDVEVGMRFPFDEGHTFIFSRALREIFKAYEEGWDEERLREEYEALGRAIIEPALESVRRAARGERVVEEFTLTFHSLEELEEYISYAASLGVQAAVTRLDFDGRAYKAHLVKAKRSDSEIRRILRTGLSPLD